MTYEQLDEYFERFDDMFPTSELKGYSEEEQEKILQECLEKDKPYHKLYKPDETVDY